MIRITNLSKSYGATPVLSDINLHIAKGDIYGLVGRSGAGKSTLLRCMNGLETFQTGTVMVNGTDISALSGPELRERRKSIGMIFQHFSLIERKTVYDNVAVPMRCWHTPRAEQQDTIERFLELVGLSDKRFTRARDLSGGQKQRVAIARAMVMDPAILLSDEATSALDPRTTDEILELLLNLNSRLGLTIVVVTHQMSVVRKICNNIAILENGICASTGEVRRIFMEQPPALRNLMGEDDIDVPESGCTIQLVTMGEESRQALFCTMSTEVNRPYRLLDSKISRCREGTFGVFVLHVGDADKDRFMAFFARQSLPCKILAAGEHAHG